MMRPDEKGAALITVLLLVAVMSVLAVALLDDIRFGIRRAANAAENGQAQWYALGAEALAASRIGQLAAGRRTSLAGNWPERTITLPVADGIIGMRLTDGAACFNLNSVVEGAGEIFQRRARGAAQFQTLAEALGVPAETAAALAAALVDWIDTDTLREAGGAEDEAYAGNARVRRTGATLLAEASELRAIHGFTEQLYRLLRPHVCALPNNEMTTINVNTLPRENAILLTALTDARLSPADAARLIAARPTGGWRDDAAFRAEPLLASLRHSGGPGDQISVRTRFFRLEAEVRHGDADIMLSSLFENAGLGTVRLVSRRWGADE
jgi:general secretion pathway protein K